MSGHLASLLLTARRRSSPAAGPSFPCQRWQSKRYL